MHICVGFDVSMSVIAASAIAEVGGRIIGPVWKDYRFIEEDYFDRLYACSKGYLLVENLLDQMKIKEYEYDEIFIGIEEAVPFGMIKTINSSSIKQQFQCQACVLGSLLNFGYENVMEINVSHWRKMIANDLGIKMNKEEFNKFTVVGWAKEKYPGIPDWPDVIQGKVGKKLKPPESIAKPIQPNDLYDSTAIMQYVWNSTYNND